MTGNGESVLAFINRVRAVQELDALPALAAVGTDPDDVQNCLLAQAMACSVDSSEHPAWRGRSVFVARFRDRWTARTVGIVTEREWSGEHHEVVLPEELQDLVVALHQGLIFTDDIGFLRGWIVAADASPDAWRLHVMPGFAEPMR